MDTSIVVATVSSLTANVAVVIQGILTVIGCVAALLHYIGVIKK